jgi:hypothetical protein
MRVRFVTPLKLVDLMVLTGAAAASFALARAAQRGMQFRQFPSSYRWLESSGICVCFWMWAVLGLRLARPRPPFHRLARQPGILACIVSLFSYGLGCIQVGTYSYTANFADVCEMALGNANATSFPIMIAWFTLAITRQWQPAPEWFDRAGRVLALYMIVVFFFGRVVLGYVIKISRWLEL